MISWFNDALDCATIGLSGLSATPEVCEQVKNGVILVMLRKYSIDLTPYHEDIYVEFVENGRPNLIIPPELLTRFLH